MERWSGVTGVRDKVVQLYSRGQKYLNIGKTSGLLFGANPGLTTAEFSRPNYEVIILLCANFHGL